MKKISIVTLFIVSSLFGLNISFKKSFDVEIKPDTIQANINIVTKKSTEKEVIESLGRLSTFINNDKDIDKKGGIYNIHPEFRYENNHRFKSGYRGSMSYTVSSKTVDKLNNFLMTLYSEKKSNSEDISLNSINWVMSKEQKAGKIDGLRLKAIKWSNNYAKSLSDSISMSCEVKSISFSSIERDYLQQPILKANLEIVSDKSAPIPTQDKEKISLNPTITLECK